MNYERYSKEVVAFTNKFCTHHSRYDGKTDEYHIPINLAIMMLMNVIKTQIDQIKQMVGVLAEEGRKQARQIHQISSLGFIALYTYLHAIPFQIHDMGFFLY